VRALGIIVALCLPASSFAQELSASRQLRRVQLTLRGRMPTHAEYTALLAADPTAQQSMITDAIDAGLASSDFYEQMVAYGHEFLKVGAYDGAGAAWKAGQAIQLMLCPANSVHAGKIGTFHSDPRLGDPPEICDDAGAMIHTVEPWWAPGTTVETIGWAGAGTTTVADAANPGDVIDCGVGRVGFSWVLRADNRDPAVTPRCSCGPNLIYCARRALQPGSSRGDVHGYDGFPNDPTGQRRSLFEEPARLFAHVVANDRPFSDLVVGDYTVVNQGLQHLYVRAARRDSRHASLDAVEWWRGVNDPAAWREVVVESMHPDLVADRDVTFDPRTDAGEPSGLPAAGVLTSIGALASFARERPRAARWLEVFACREFEPPPDASIFPPFERDPGAEGVCLQCHALIDPAAIHFKRFTPDGLGIGGIGRWRIERFLSYDTTRIRWEAQFAHDTVLTPVTEAAIAMDGNVRFLDFLPPGDSLFGLPSDGTIGPLGFGKLLVASGELDRCAVRRFYERFGGRALDPAAHADFIDRLVEVFRMNGRSVRPLVRFILSQDAFRLGR